MLLRINCLTLCLNSFFFVIAFFAVCYAEEVPKTPFGLPSISPLDLSLSAQNNNNRKAEEIGVFDYPIDPKTYKLGPGDVISIDVVKKITHTNTLMITPQGGIVLPDIGFISTQGHSITSFQTYLTQYLSPKVNLKSILVCLIKAKRVRVTISGAIDKFGTKTLSPPFRLSDALKKVKILPWGRTDNIRISKDGNQTFVNYFLYSKTGDPNYNPILSTGSIIQIPSCQEKGNKIILNVKNYQTILCIPEGATLSDLPFLFPKGFEKDWSKSTVQIKRNGKTQAFPSYSNVGLKNEDSLSIMPEQSSIFIHGLVKRGGAFDYSPETTIAQYISKAGGEHWQGSYRNVKIYRNGEKIYLSKNSTLLAGDIIYMPGRPIAYAVEYTAVLGGIASLLFTVIMAITIIDNNYGN